MSNIPNKKAIVTDENCNDIKEYKCLSTGRCYENPVGHFYKSNQSHLWDANNKYCPICKDKLNEMFDKFSRQYQSDEAALLICCHYLDVPFYRSLYKSIVEKNTDFSLGLYMRQISNNRQYQYKTFVNTLFDGELNKSDADLQEEKEVKWNKQDQQNKNDVIEVVGYDPFEGYKDEDRKFLFNELIKYFDDDIAEDTYKLSQIIQIVNNNNQIRKYDLEISQLNPCVDGDKIQGLNGLKKNLVDSNDKIAKENEISVKNRSNKQVGKSTLTYLMKDLREKDFDKAEANYYDQLKSNGTLWAENMSMKAIKENGFFDENDYKEIRDINRELVTELQHKVDDLLEEKRQLLIQIDNLKNGDNNE